MTDYLTTDTELTSIANAIREKSGTSAQLTYPVGFVDAIDAIETGGGGVYQAISAYVKPQDANTLVLPCESVDKMPNNFVVSAIGDSRLLSAFVSKGVFSITVLKDDVGDKAFISYKSSYNLGTRFLDFSKIKWFDYEYDAENKTITITITKNSIVFETATDYRIYAAI